MTGKRSLIAAASLLAAVAAPAGAQCPKTGGTLTYVYHPEPTALSTVATSAVPVAIISTKIYESLLTYEGPGLTPKPGLAESWTVSDDHKTYTFKLRQGVKWHDGKPFTADDVKYAIEKVVTPYTSRGRVYFGDVEEITVPDPYTVVFRLKAPVPFFMNVFQPGEAPILPKHILETIDTSSAGPLRQSALMRQPVGTGPFRLKEWTRGSHVILERNPDYWRKGHPCLDQIVLRVLPDGAARAIALESGEVDLAPMSALPEAELERIAKLPQIETSKQGAEALGPNMWLEVNMREKPLSDVKVRQAISMALDRSRIVDVIWYGQGTPGTGPVVSANPAYNKALKPYPYDPRRAAQLLDEAGYKRGPDGVRFKITQNFLPYGENWVRLAEYVRQELGKLGIAVEIKSADLGGWLKTVYTDWDFNLTSTFSHNYSDPSIGVERTFTTRNIRKGATFTNSMGYSNPRVDELFAKAARETDKAARKKQFDEIQQILHDELPVIFLVELSYTSAWNKRVKGLITNGISMYSSWDSVWKE
ncbi:MAG: ABC transporter substrate-binding protein [Alphaproteobacteria bacterium]